MVHSALLPGQRRWVWHELSGSRTLRSPRHAVPDADVLSAVLSSRAALTDAPPAPAGSPWAGHSGYGVGAAWQSRESARSTRLCRCFLGPRGGCPMACSRRCGDPFPPFYAVAAAAQIPLVRSVMTWAFTSFRRNSFSRWMLCVQDWKGTRDKQSAAVPHPDAPAGADPGVQVHLPLDSCST